MINTASQTESTPGPITGQPSPTGSIAGQPSPTQSPTVVPGITGKKTDTKLTCKPQKLLSKIIMGQKYFDQNHGRPFGHMC